jgi:hypothetical protein
VKSDPRRAWRLLRTYVTQETIGPLKGAGRWMLVGTVAAFVTALGCCFLLLATLRGTQDLLRVVGRDGAWGLLAYAATLVVGTVCVIVAAGRIGKGTL